MLISVFFPIADARRFLEGVQQPLPAPYWPFPRESQFLRSFGPVKKRKEFKDWIPEPFVCDARRGIRVPLNLVIKVHSKMASGTRLLHFDVVGRRYFFDGAAMGKLELAFRLHKQDEIYSKQISARTVLDGLSKLELTIAIPRKNGTELKRCKLRDLTRNLPLQILASTTPVSSLKNEGEHASWIASGTPVVIISDVEIRNPKQSVRRTATVYAGKAARDIDIVHSNEPSNWFCAYWVITGPKDTKAIRRKFRLTIGRLHCESVVLREVLRMIASSHALIQPRTPQSNLLQEYLLRVTREILALIHQNGTTIHNVSDKENEVSYAYFREAHRVFYETTKGERDLIIALLKRTLAVRGNVLRRVEELFNDSGFVDLHEQFKAGGFVMNKYFIDNKGNIGAVGDINEAGDITGTGHAFDINLNLELLGKELDQLIGVAKAGPGQISEKEIGALVSASDAAKKGNYSDVLRALKSVGDEVLEISKKIGIPVAIEVIKKSISI